MRSNLSPRELEVLRHAAQGKTNRIIGDLLGLTENTIKTHLGRIFAKLEVANRTEAIHVANVSGLLTPAVQRFRRLTFEVLGYQATVRSQILTEYGPLVIEPGDWVIRCPHGDTWPVKASRFYRYYEPVLEGRSE